MWDCLKCNGVGAGPAETDPTTRQAVREDCDLCDGSGVA